MTEHSEAPWTFDPAPSDAGSDALRGHIVPNGAGIDDPCVAWIEGVGSVDLALILAAPDLLKAAELAVWLMDRVAGWEDDVAPITKFAATVHGNQFRAAIAKVKGGAS